MTAITAVSMPEGGDRLLNMKLLSADTGSLFAQLHGVG